MFTVHKDENYQTTTQWNFRFKKNAAFLTIGGIKNR